MTSRYCPATGLNMRDRVDSAVVGLEGHQPRDSRPAGDFERCPSGVPLEEMKGGDEEHMWLPGGGT